MRKYYIDMNCCCNKPPVITWHNTFTIRLYVTWYKEAMPLTKEMVEVALYVWNEYNRCDMYRTKGQVVSVDNNVVTVLFPASEQKLFGSYGVELRILDEQGRRRNTVIADNAFILDRYNRAGSGCASVKDVELYMDVQVPADGLNAYECWLMAGNEGTLQDYLDWLRGPGNMIAEELATVLAEGQLMMARLQEIEGGLVTTSERLNEQYPDLIERAQALVNGANDALQRIEEQATEVGHNVEWVRDALQQCRAIGDEMLNRMADLSEQYTVLSEGVDADRADYADFKAWVRRQTDDLNTAIRELGGSTSGATSELHALILAIKAELEQSIQSAADSATGGLTAANVRIDSTNARIDTMGEAQAADKQELQGAIAAASEQLSASIDAVSERLDNSAIFATEPTGDLTNPSNDTVPTTNAVAAAVEALMLQQAEDKAELTAMIAGAASGGVVANNISVSFPIGMYGEGDTIAQGTSISTVLSNMLQREYYPTLTAPTATANIAGLTGLYEQGVTVSGKAVEVTFNHGSINPAYGTSGKRAGAATEYGVRVVLEGGTELWSNTSAENVLQLPDLTANCTVQCTVAYAEGEQPLSSMGNAYEQPLPAGNVSASPIAVTFVLPIYANAADNSTVAKQRLTAYSAKSLTLTMAAAAANSPEIIDVPAALSGVKIMVLNELSGKYEDGTSQFDTSTVEHQAPNGTAYQYVRYTDRRGLNVGARSIKITWN